MVVAWVVELLLTMWETWSVFPDPGFDLVKSWPLWTFGEQTSYLSFFVTQTLKKKKGNPVNRINRNLDTERRIDELDQELANYALWVKSELWLVFYNLQGKNGFYILRVFVKTKQNKKTTQKYATETLCDPHNLKYVLSDPLMKKFSNP